MGRSWAHRVLVFVVGVLAASVVGAPVGSDPVAGAETPSETLTAEPLARGNARFVDAALRDLLGRASTPADHEHWTEPLDEGTLARGEFARSVAQTTEWARVIVNDLYVQVLGRSPDPEGRDYWSQRLAGGDRTASLAALMYASEEFYATAGGTDPAYVDEVYATILERRPDAEGRAYWIDRLAGGGPRTVIARQFFLTVESNAKRVDGLYRKLLSRAPDPGGRAFWARRLVRVDDLVLSGQLVASEEYFSIAQSRFEEASLTTAEGTVVITAEDLVSVTVDESGAGSAVIADGVPVPEAGGHAVLVPDDPTTEPLVVGEVTAVSAAAGGTRVAFTPAAFTDAFTSGEVTSRVEIVPDGGPSGRGRNGGGAQGRGGWDCGSSIAEKLSARLGIDPTFDGHLRFDAVFGIPPVEYDARAVMEFNPSAVIDIAALEAEAGCGRRLFERNWNQVIPVGPVPLPVTGGFEVRAEVAANWPGVGLSASASLSCDAGFEASTDEGFDRVSSCGSLTSQASFSPGAAGSVTTSLPVEVDAGIGADTVVGGANLGLEGSITPSVAANADPNQDPWWWVDFTVDAALAAELELGPVNPSHDLGNWELYTTRLLEAPPESEPPATPLRITTSELPRATVGDAYTATLAATGGRGPYTWAATALPSGLDLQGNVITGTPTDVGTQDVGLTVRDADGTTTGRTLSLRTDSGSPWPVGDDEGDPAYFAWLGSSFFFPNWTSCGTDLCLAGDGSNVLVTELDPLNDVGTVPQATDDPLAAITSLGVPAAQASAALSSGPA